MNKTTVIPVNTPLFAGNEPKYLEECIRSGWISSEGPFVERFEQGMAGYVGRRYGVAVSSGSAALDIAVKALDIGKGDEVIVPAFTIISPAASVVRQGGVPVLADSDPATWNMDVKQVAARITPRTKAIIAVHIYGLPVDMDPLLALAKKHRLKVIEDAAEMHGQTYNGRPCGSFGDVSVFSFYPNKHITTGEGGMLVTNDEKLAERFRSLRNLAFRPGRRFVHEELGWNYRMTNLQAAVGLAQLERIGTSVARKREIGSIYNRLLKDVPGLALPPDKAAYAESIYWVYGLLLDKVAGIAAAEAMERLGKKGVGTRPFFHPMHLQPVFNNMGLFRGEKYPVAEELAEHGFYIPCGLGISDDEIRSVARAVREVAGAFGRS